MLCFIFVAMAFSWQLVAHFSSSASLSSFMKQPQHLLQKLSGVLSVHRKQFFCFCWSTWTMVWFNQNPEFSTSLSEFQHYWLASSVPWTLFYMPFLFCRARSPLLVDPVTILLLSPWLRRWSHQCSSAWKMRGFVRSPNTHIYIFYDHTQTAKKQITGENGYL